MSKVVGDIPQERRAPDGQVWRCSACGKWAEDQYGMIGRRSPGWDESCMLNAVPTSDTPPWGVNFLREKRIPTPPQQETDNG